MEQGSAAAEGYIDAVIRTHGAIMQAADAQRDWTQYLDGSIPIVDDATSAHEAWRLGIYKVGDALAGLPGELDATTVAVIALGGAFQNSKPVALEYAEALYEVSSALADVRKDAAAV